MAEETTAKDPEQVAKNKARLERRDKAFTLLKEIADKSDKKYQQALAVLRPSLYGLAPRGPGGSSLSTKVVEFIVGKKTATEMELFQAFKIGRKEAGQQIRHALKKAEKSQRQWINFDPTKGVYVYLGIGDNAPKEYTGHVPAEPVALK